MAHQHKQAELAEREKEIAQWVGAGFLLVLAGLVIYLRVKAIIPGPAKIIDLLEQGYANYGYWVVFLSAILEGLVIINLYFPGSTAILLGVILAERSGLSVPLVIVTAIVGFSISYSVNYLIGRFGISRLLDRFGYGKIIKETSEKLKEKGPGMILTSLFHPNLGAFVTTGAGVIKMPVWQYAIATLTGLIVWDSIWGLLASTLGEQIIKLFESWLIIPLLIAWTLFALIPTMIRKR